MSKNANPSPLSINQEELHSKIVYLVAYFVDDTDRANEMIDDVTKLLTTYANTLLDRVESEVIGENEKLDATKNYAKHYLEDGHNDLRLYQRQALQALRKELE